MHQGLNGKDGRNGEPGENGVPVSIYFFFFFWNIDWFHFKLKKVSYIWNDQSSGVWTF